jgi:translation initiation factor 5B
MLLIQLTQQLMSHRLMFTPHTQATILEVKSIDGFGTTVDVVLVNGELKEGDTIVVCGMAGPIVTQIRALLTPPPLREMRIKSDYVHHKSIEAAMGVKIVASDLDKAVAGTEVLVVHPDDEIEDLKEEVMEDFENIMKGFKKDAVGVYVQASTLGSLEALLQYLHTHKPPVPVASVGIGPLHKKDVMIASTMLEHKQVYATILAFDVKITSDASDMAERLGVKIITADIIYHLTDQFDAFLKEDLAKKQAESLAEAVFPVIARIIPTNVFNAKDPIVCGVDVLEGTLKIGTPLCVVLPKDKVVKAGGIGDDKGGNQGIAIMQSGINILSIGRVAGIQINHVEKTEAEAGGPSVALKIEPANDSQRAIMYGRHFDHNQLLYAHVSRGSIDKLKDNFRDKMTKDNWKTIIKLKGLLGVETFSSGSS